jgi:serine/threonine-protein kinase
MEELLPLLQAAFPDLVDLQPLGGGGQKRVFSAAHAVDGSVVLKIIFPIQHTEDIHREILAVQKVNSSRVPRICEHGVIEMPFGKCYWIREARILGSTLRVMLQDGPLAVKDVLNLARHTLEALENAEAVSIVHRDVKPENLIGDGAGNFWLLDFGIARHLTLDSRTATALPFGKMTLGYAPPEQCRNLKPRIDSRADLFALGVTIYEAATGGNPFIVGARDPMEILRRVENDSLGRLALDMKRADEFADLVLAMTQKRRMHRQMGIQETLVWLKEICDAQGP